MRVAIDGRMISYSGIGRYIKNLALNLPKIDEKTTFSVLLSKDDYAGLKGPLAGANVEAVAMGREIPVYSMKEQWLLPLEIGSLKADIVHYPSFNMPVLGPGPSVVTIHDLNYYLNASLCPGRAAHYYARVQFYAAARRAKRVITDSEHTKKDVVRHLGIKPGKVAAIPLGMDDSLRPVLDEGKLKTIRDKYGINGEYILYVGNHYDNKNLVRLIQAYSMMKKKRDVTLVIGGRTDSRRKRLYETPGALGLEGSVAFTGYVADEDLPGLYTMASLFVFPSLYEGFGLPPLEAMACGTPVVCSNATSLPEVVGDAALTFDPLDTGDMAQKMEEALSDNLLRSELREKGFKRAASFTWRSTAAKTLLVYMEALG